MTAFFKALWSWGNRRRASHIKRRRRAALQRAAEREAWLRDAREELDGIVGAIEEYKLLARPKRLGCRKKRRR